jgi:Ca-activated chloride channel family protein
VFLTDGAVGNEQALFAAVSREIGDSRLFTVGIGSAPNALFMTRAAKFGRGTFTYIGSTNEVEQKIGALFRQLASPVLTDVHVLWESAPGTDAIVQTPATVADLYAGEPLVLAARSGATLERVRISGSLGGRRWQHSARLQGAARGEGIHALWARRMIEDWMGRLVTGEDPVRVRDAVLALALEHHLVSRYTSLVAVDRTPARPETAQLRSAAVPSRLPAGWSGNRVFGRLPDTATSAPLFTLAGLLGLLLAWATARRRA